MEGPYMDDGHLKESARTKKKKKGAWSKIKVALASIAKVLTHLNNLGKYSRGQRMVKELRQEEEMAMRRALEESMRDEFTGPAAAAASREDQMQLEESRKLREEQDREYEEALKADRKREEAQTKNEQLREEVSKEEEVEKREEKKKEEQPSLPIVPEAIAATIGTTSDLQKPPEPEGHHAINEVSLEDEFNNKEVTLAIRLPGGQRLQRQFRADNTIGDVRRFVDSIEKEEREKVKEEGPFLLEDYDLVGSWPPSPHFSDLDQTLADAGLYPRALLCVQERI